VALKSKKLDVMVAGDLFVDIIMSGFSFWPQPGEEAVATDYCREVGGGAAITAYGLAKLGLRTGVLGIVGSDTGNWVIERLRLGGIDTSGMYYDPSEPTAFSIAVSDTRDRTFFTYLGANRYFPQRLMEAANEHLLAHARHVHLACAPELETADLLFEALSKSDCRVSLDVGWHEAWLADPRALDLLPKIDLFFPNEREAFRMTGEQDPERILRRFESAGARGVALKLGSQGAALLWKGTIYHAAPFSVQPVDTTGAGDCFDAGFLYAWLQGQPPAAWLHAGTVCGGLSTEALGGLAAFPTLDRLQALMKGETCPT
jgi:sugar/nucleoside kinase (ribokinase family)